MALSNYIFFKENPSDFRMFSAEHIVAVLIIAVLAVLLVVYRKELSELPKAQRRKLEIGAGILLLVARGGLYLYYFTFNIGIKEVLPIYICRVVIIALLYTLFTGKKTILFIAYFFGAVFGVLPLIIVDTGGYTFPHAMYFSFFVGHGLILLLNLYFILVDGYRPTKKDLKKTLIALAIYFGIIAILNPLVNGNYNYLQSAPSSIPLGAFDGTIGYKISLISLFAMVMVLEYLPFAKAKPLTEEEAGTIDL